MQSIDVTSTIRQLYEEFRPQVPQGISYLLVPGAGQLSVTADPATLRDIMITFLTNAVKHQKKSELTRGHGLIIIGWQYDYTIRELQLFVEDNGAGMDTDDDKAWTGKKLSKVKKNAADMDFHTVLFTEKGVGSRFEIRKIL